MIDDIVYPYDRVRRDFGRPIMFTKEETRPGDFIPHDESKKAAYAPKNPKTITLGNIPEFSEHAISTDRVATTSKGMHHTEGGWPSNVDPTEPNDIRKEKKKRDKNPDFIDVQIKLFEAASVHMKENNHIDLFQEYYEGEVPDQSSESLYTKTLRLFKDPKQRDAGSERRVVSRISMIQEVPHRFAASYATHKFQKASPTLPLESYVWDVNSPNEPTHVILPPSPITSIAFSNKFTDILAAGMYNGQVLFWDLRADKPQVYTPSDTDKPKMTDAEKSHYDAVFDVVWPTSKTGAECISAAPDGRVFWWDWRNLQQGPVTTSYLTDGLPGDRLLGATRIDNCMEQSMKVLIGTEQGYVAQVMRKPGNKAEVINRFGMEGGKHHGPIFAIQRNPAQQISKFFLTVGDWTAKIWADDLKVPIITTRYHDAYLTDGCWSTTRPGIFFLTRSDGWIDIWDYYYRQNEVCYSQKISDYSLTCIAAKPKTSDVLIGDASGSITLLQLCKSLWEPQPKGVEERHLKEIYDRESSREKALMTQRRAMELKKEKEKEKPKEVKQADKKKSVVENRIKELEADFFKTVKLYQEEVEGVAMGGGAKPETKPEKKEEKKDEDEYKFDEGDKEESPAKEAKAEEKKEAYDVMQMALVDDLIAGDATEPKVEDKKEEKAEGEPAPKEEDKKEDQPEPEQKNP